MLLATSSCSDDDGPASDISWLVNEWWIGEHTYYNPVSGTKTNYVYFKFLDNGRGEYALETQTNYVEGYFRYHISGNTISCTGITGGTDGGFDTSWSATLTISDNRDTLYYNSWELTRN